MIQPLTNLYFQVSGSNLEDHAKIYVAVFSQHRVKHDLYLSKSHDMLKVLPGGSCIMSSESSGENGLDVYRCFCGVSTYARTKIL